jgi:hypothetical protein
LLLLCEWRREILIVQRRIDGSFLARPLTPGSVTEADVFIT